MIPHTYTKMFTRDFTLATVETWCKAESTDLRQWTIKQQPCKPFIVFERNDEVVSVFYDPEGIEWIQHELSTLIKEDSSFITLLIKTFSHQITELKLYLDHTPLLSLPELKEFITKARKAWAWFEAMWWLIENLDNKKDTAHLSLLLELRKYSEKLASATDVIIRKSMANTISNKEYAEVILLEELFSGKIPSESVLKRRLKHYFYTDNTLFEDTSSQELEEKYSFAFEKENLENFQNRVVKGSMAYPGKVQGKIRRVMSYKDLHLMKKGEILISSMTLPDFVPAMEKASAIVTDEGGILCHAAIIARELKIPCIVGTGNATTFFQDGGLVEVDADNGVVRKIDK